MRQPGQGLLQLMQVNDANYTNFSKIPHKAQKNAAKCWEYTTPSGLLLTEACSLTSATKQKKIQGKSVMPHKLRQPSQTKSLLYAIISNCHNIANKISRVWQFQGNPHHHSTFLKTCPFQLLVPVLLMQFKRMSNTENLTYTFFNYRIII